MTRKPSKPFRMVPLQKLAVKPIEDPAEQAALDEKLRKREIAAREPARERAGSKRRAP